jgi:hypothetical protein
MRTTVNIPDDVYEVARSLAHAKRISVGDAIGELARRGLRPAGREVKSRSAFPCFRVRPDAPPIPLEATLQAEDEL